MGDGVLQRSAFQVVSTRLRELAEKKPGRDLSKALIALEVVEALREARLLPSSYAPVVYVKRLSRWEHFLHAIGWK